MGNVAASKVVIVFKTAPAIVLTKARAASLCVDLSQLIAAGAARFRRLCR